MLNNSNTLDQSFIKIDHVTEEEDWLVVGVKADYRTRDLSLWVPSVGVFLREPRGGRKRINEGSETISVLNFVL